MRVLLAEDEKSLARALVKIFAANNFSADAVYDGRDALDYIESGSYDAAVLDVMMPGMDGFEVLRELRRKGNTVPVLMLTARSEVEDKVNGLDLGANYYLTKPFDARELVAALRAITRKGGETDSTLRLGNTLLDRSTYELSAPGGSFRLANREFQMMEMFMSAPRKIISGERFMEVIWGFDSDAEMSVVWAYISYLRKKLSALGSDLSIKVHRNAGYSLEEQK
ncbi:MAG: response regulator transcription factor [Clostridia bacterium]|nr:response regulator transcription factor [Clostridia bacterium]